MKNLAEKCIIANDLKDYILIRYPNISSGDVVDILNILKEAIVKAVTGI